MSNTADMREHMIEGQILPGHVMNAALVSALRAVPRELFVPSRYKHAACVDDNIPLSPGRYLMEPLLFARLLEAAEIAAGDTVLDIGCATGYSTAVIARLARRVVGVEEQRELADKARHMMDALEIPNAEIVTGSQPANFSSKGPYDVIVISGGGMHAVPLSIQNQLKEGGRLAAIENIALRPDAGVGLGKAMIMQKIKGAIYRKKVFDACVPVLPGFETRPGFVF